MARKAISNNCDKEIVELLIVAPTNEQITKVFTVPGENSACDSGI